ncbi:hypothetical protein SAMN05444162_0341 [Paenibacillaceae bacterium GAS479]|nr:hypothetical protein SAMN05444162_0341 [Paenibacillaceae bacterium GAS479]
MVKTSVYCIRCGSSIIVWETANSTTITGGGILGFLQRIILVGFVNVGNTGQRSTYNVVPIAATTNAPVTSMFEILVSRPNAGTLIVNLNPPTSCPAESFTI